MDPAFNTTLQNTQDTVTTPKKINKDRKTTVNIQEGLLFSICDMGRQTEDAALVAHVSKIAEKYNGTGCMCRMSE